MPPKPAKSDSGRKQASLEVRIAVLETQKKNLEEKVLELKDKVRELKGTVKEVKAERDDMQSRLRTIVQKAQHAHRKQEDEMRKMQNEVQSRMQMAKVDPHVQSGILQYMKQGFGTMLGALGAIMVVGVVGDMLTPDESDFATDGFADDEADDNVITEDAGFDLGGGLESFKVASIRSGGGAAAKSGGRKKGGASPTTAVTVEKVGSSTPTPRRARPDRRKA